MHLTQVHKFEKREIRSLNINFQIHFTIVLPRFFFELTKGISMISSVSYIR